VGHVRSIVMSMVRETYRAFVARNWADKRDEDIGATFGCSLKGDHVIEPSFYDSCVGVLGNGLRHLRWVAHEQR